MGLRARVARAAPEGPWRATWRAAAVLGSIAGATLAVAGGGAPAGARPAVAVRSATPVPAARAEPLGRWSTAARLAPPGTVLTDLSCSSARACMAVGDQPAASSGAASMAAYVWNGRSWRAAPVPAGMHAGLSFAELTEVSCASADDCLAAGLGFASATSPFRYDVLHWNGRRWSRTGEVLAASWNGRRWRVEPLPGLSVPGLSVPGLSVPGLTPVALSCSSVSFCMAVTDLDAEATGYLVAAEQDDRAYVWHGGNWSRVAWPDRHDVPSALACTSQRSCLAVAAQAGPHVPPSASEHWLRWDGRRWALQARPMPGAIAVTSVSCATSGRCMAVGASRSDDVALDVARSDYWDGRAWQVAGGPPTVPGSGAFEAVACLRAPSCLAVVGASWTNWRP